MSGEKPLAGGLLRIGELAKASGTNLSTVKYYVKEGLIRPACKTGRNMAYYDPACVGTIGMIRMLQRERFYPLSVIKRLLESSPLEEPELELLDAIHKVDYKTTANRTGLSEAVRQTRLSTAQIAALVEAGLITPEGEGRRQAFTGADLTVMDLIRRRMDAGIPFAQSVRAFTIYARALGEAAQADVDAFTAGALMVPDFTAETGAQMIRVSDETLDVFVGLKRKEYNRQYGSRRLQDLDRFEAALTAALARMRAALEAAGLRRDAALCAAALTGSPSGVAVLDEAAGQYWSFIRETGGDIAKSIAGSVRSREFFAALRPEAGSDGALPVWCLKLSWLTLAPPILACGGWAKQARTEFTRFLQTYDGAPPDLAAQLVRSLHPEEGSL